MKNVTLFFFIQQLIMKEFLQSFLFRDRREVKNWQLSLLVNTFKDRIMELIYSNDDKEQMVTSHTSLEST